MATLLLGGAGKAELLRDFRLEGRGWAQLFALSALERRQITITVGRIRHHCGVPFCLLLPLLLLRFLLQLISLSGGAQAPAACREFVKEAAFPSLRPARPPLPREGDTAELALWRPLQVGEPSPLPCVAESQQRPCWL